jgi:hypothetical protein
MAAGYYRADTEAQRRDVSRREHELTMETSLSHIAKDLTIWLAGRNYPNRGAQSTRQQGHAGSGGTIAAV